MPQKTEAPTQRRITQARQKGQVPHSRELVSASIFTVLVSYLWYATVGIFHRIVNIIDAASHIISHHTHNQSQAIDTDYLYLVLQQLSGIMLPILVIVFITGITANVAHVGLVFAPNVIMPNLSKLNPLQGLKKIFSKNNLFELCKTIFKIFFLGTIIYLVIVSSIKSLVMSPLCGFNCVVAVLSDQIYKIILYTILVLLVFASFDIFFQRYRYIQQLRMSKEEVFREYKEMEGDPLIKSKRKQLHQELMNQGIKAKVQESSVVVSNPTHVANAIYYRTKKTPLPKLMIKGQGGMAKFILDVAKESNIPIIRNVSLARSLYSTCEEGRYITRDLLVPLAEVIRWLKKHRPDLVN